MTSKDDLMNIFHQSASDQEASVAREANDIKESQESVRTFFIELRSWFEDMSVKIERNRTSSHDVTTRSTNSYPMDFMSISNGNEHLKFRPKAFYLMKAKLRFDLLTLAVI